MNSIARRLTLPFAGFVVAGSLALVWWLGVEERRQMQELLATTARTNVEFIRGQNLPLTERTARSLSDVLGVQMAFTAGPQSRESLAQSDHVLLRAHAALVARALEHPQEVQSDGWHEAVAWPFPAPAANPTEVVVVRPVPDTGFLWKPRTLTILGVFWALSIALAWVLARGIVRPLRTFAARLPKIAEETTEPLPEAQRPDEIGQLARAYAKTRAQLTEERAARERAERLATLGRMATGLAHEINNPVAAIKLHAQLLEGEVNGASPERLEIILSESAKIESLVSQWMFLARPQPPQMAAWNLAELVRASVRTLEPAAAHARVRMEQEIDDALRVTADRRRLGQAVVNVLANAIHALAARGGMLIIRSQASGDGTVALSFSDTGPGFSAAALARATELFFSEKEGGMGIGLSVTAEIVRAHGGELILANAPTGGAVVTMRLPAVPGERAAVPGPAALQAS
jgi:signal transduction histidine kinase